MSLLWESLPSMFFDDAYLTAIFQVGCGVLLICSVQALMAPYRARWVYMHMITLGVCYILSLTHTLCVCMRVCMCEWAGASYVCLSVCLSVYLSICLSVCLSTCMGVYVCVCLFVSLCVCVQCVLAKSFSYRHTKRDVAVAWARFFSRTWCQVL